MGDRLLPLNSIRWLTKTCSISVNVKPVRVPIVIELLKRHLFSFVTIADSRDGPGPDMCKHLVQNNKLILFWNLS